MEVIPAYERPLKEKGPVLDDYKKRFEPACSGYVLHLGVDKKDEHLGAS
jgi:diapolycopene oxygenase